MKQNVLRTETVTIERKALREGEFEASNYAKVRVKDIELDYGIVGLVTHDYVWSPEALIELADFLYELASALRENTGDDLPNDSDEVQLF